MNRETALQKDICAAVNRSGRARLLRNNVGFASKEKVIYGLGNGSPDLVGVLLPLPGSAARCFCIEVKTPGSKLRPDQLAWWRAAYRWGVLGGVAHSVEEAFALIDLAEAGIIKEVA